MNDVQSIRTEARITREVARRLGEINTETREHLSLRWIKLGIASLLLSGTATVVTVLHQAGVL